MAGVSTEQGGNSLSTDLNLVPFIDLLSTLVLFLLVTAVWMQVGAISASIDSKGKSANSVAEQKRVLVRVTAGGCRIQWPVGVKAMPAVTACAQLLPILQKASKAAKLPMVAVAADDGVPYGNVVAAVDAAKSAGSLVALSTE